MIVATKQSNAEECVHRVELEERARCFGLSSSLEGTRSGWGGCEGAVRHSFVMVKVRNHVELRFFFHVCRCLLLFRAVLVRLIHRNFLLFTCISRNVQHFAISWFGR